MRGRIWQGATVGVAAVMVAAPAAGQQARTSVDATVSSGISANPFLTDGDGTSSAYVEGVLAPQLSLVDERGQTSIGAYVRGTKYFDDYGTTWAIGGSAQAQRAVNAKLTLRGAVQIDSSVLGERRGNGILGLPEIEDDTDPTLPAGVTSPPPILTPPPTTALPPEFLGPDITLLGLRRRQTTFGGTAGLSYALSARDSVSADAQVQRSQYGGGFFDFSTYGGTLGYSRALSSLTQVGGRISAQYTDYDVGGNGQVYTPQVTISTTINTRWSLNAGAGLLFVRTRTLVDRDSSTGISANVQLCRAGERSNLCVSGSRDAGPNGLGAVSRRLALGANYSYRLNETDSVRLSADYSRVSNDRRLLNNQDPLLNDQDAFSYASVSGDWDHRFARRLTGGVALRYRDTLSGGFSRSGDYSAAIFLRTRLGRLQ